MQQQHTWFFPLVSVSSCAEEADCLGDGRQDITLAQAAKNNTSVALGHLHYVS